MKKIISIFVPHCGCPHRCIFCHQPHITGVSLQTSLTPEAIQRTIEQALTEPKSRQRGAQFEVAFYGGTFTGLALELQEQFLRTVQAYVDRGQVSGIRLSTHPRMFTEQILTVLSRYSVHMIELGVQSFDDKILRDAGRGHTADDVETIVRILQEMGIQVGMHLMVGLPGDSYETSLYTARKTCALNPSCARIHPTLVIRGTQLETLYQQGAYVPLSLNAAVTTCKDMLRLFQARQIPVIRIGLQPTASMEQAIVAGPYHPAIRQLVESEMFYERMCALENATSGKALTYAVSPKDLSTARGQKNANIHKLQKYFGCPTVKIVSDPALQRGHIRFDPS